VPGFDRHSRAGLRHESVNRLKSEILSNCSDRKFPFRSDRHGEQRRRRTAWRRLRLANDSLQADTLCSVSEQAPQPPQGSR
jgi:hypothetical protein